MSAVAERGGGQVRSVSGSGTVLAAPNAAWGSRLSNRQKGLARGRLRDRASDLSGQAHVAAVLGFRGQLPQPGDGRVAFALQ